MDIKYLTFIIIGGLIILSGPFLGLFFRYRFIKKTQERHFELENKKSQDLTLGEAKEYTSLNIKKIYSLLLPIIICIAVGFVFIVIGIFYFYLDTLAGLYPDI